MAGYLDQYGVVDARRERLTKQIILWGLIAVVIGAVLFFYFRNWSEERRVNQFLDLLKQHNYQEAYRLWGCTPDTPCRYYGPDRFTQDWGPEGIYKNASDLKIEDVDACGAGVVFHFTYPGADDFGLWVERSTKNISFAPAPRCPGPHLQLWRFIKSRFGG
jgi:hypothetical protein